MTKKRVIITKRIGSFVNVFFGCPKMLKRGAKMVYKNELDFLCETLKKIHVRTAVVSKDTPIREVFDIDI